MPSTWGCDHKNMAMEFLGILMELKSTVPSDSTVWILLAAFSQREETDNEAEERARKPRGLPSSHRQPEPPIQLTLMPATVAQRLPVFKIRSECAGPHCGWDILGRGQSGPHSGDSLGAVKGAEGFLFPWKQPQHAGWPMLLIGPSNVIQQMRAPRVCHWKEEEKKTWPRCSSLEDHNKSDKIWPNLRTLVECTRMELTRARNKSREGGPEAGFRWQHAWQKTVQQLKKQALLP